MKVWIGYGSEHSANLVMIGRFETHSDAQAAAHLLGRINEWVARESETGGMDVGWESSDRMTEATRKFLMDLHLYSFSLSDLENFAYEHHVSVVGTALKITTDETEVQGFLKILIEKGAHVQVYSAHDWNEDASPRMAEPEENEDGTQLG
jgi:hypothetical protein